jgi:uncharacterized protein
MRRLYVDTSALVPVYVPEVFSVRAENVVRRQSARIVSSLCVAEFASAVSFKQREGELAPEDAQRAWQTFTRHASSGLFHVTEVTVDDWRRAAELAWSLHTRARTLDAIHLSVAERMQLTLVSADERQVAAARELGLKVVDIRA